jgi:CelD/BcsL family acetyltransferase involved in cellulose biosynthesis
MPTIKIIRDLREIDPGQWRILLARCPDSTVFQSAEWQQAWWRNFGGEFEPFILAAYEGPHLVGLASLYRRPKTVLGITRDELQFIGSGQSDYNLFSSMDGSEAVIAALLDELARHIDAGACARLTEIPQSSVTYALLNQRRATGLTGLQLSSTTPCPRLQIEGNRAGVAAVLSKDSLKRHYKALAKLGTIRVEHHTDAAVATSHLAELFRQHIARWENTPFPSLFLDPANQRFYHDMVNALGQAKQIILTTIHLDSRPVAMHLGFRSGRDFVWYKPTFDPALQKYSPGETLLKSLIEYAQAEEYAVFDFTRGDERFKSRFATSVRQNSSYEWIPRRLDRYCWEAARHARRVLRTWTKRASGDGASAAPPAAETSKTSKSVQA